MHFFLGALRVKGLDGPLCAEKEHGLKIPNNICLNPCFICIVCISITLMNSAGIVEVSNIKTYSRTTISYENHTQ